MTDSTSPVVIIGAGIGGLSTAIRLAAHGRRVVMYEQNPAVGGKMSQFTAAGFRWDTGPSVITMRHVFTDLFAAAGRNLDDYLTLRPVDPLTRYFYQDGTVLDISRDLPHTLRQIEQLHPPDVDGYLRYLAYAARIHRITGPVFIYDKPPSPRSFLRVPPTDIFKIDAWRTMNTAVRSFVKSPHLRQLLNRFATYVGASPYKAPATLNVIAHVELNGGVWYPQGGIYAIAAAMAELATELGVEIHTDTAVEQITLTADGKRVSGVQVNGRTQPASAVVANVDVATVYEKLLPARPSFQKRLRKLKQIDPSCSGFILMLGVDKQHPQLAHHNIFFGRDYPAEFKSIFDHGRMPPDPTIYVAITSKTDPEHAPPGGENWFVLVNAPPLGSGWDWATQADAYREHLLDRLAEAHQLDIRPHIRTAHTLTPADLQRLTGAHRGALYGTSSNSMWAAFQRPHNRAPDVSGLYFAGGTAHPGGGVPMVTLSGKVAAEMVLANE